MVSYPNQLGDATVTKTRDSATSRNSEPKDMNLLSPPEVPLQRTGSIGATSRRSRNFSFRVIYSQTSIYSVRATNAVMAFLRRTAGMGVFLGLACALFYSFSSLIVKFLNTNFRMHPFMLAAIRQFFQALLAGPQVAYCKAPYYGKNKAEWIPLCIRAAAGAIAITLQFMAISYMPLGDVAVIYATTPAFTTLIAWIALKERCHFSDIPVLFLAFLGVAFILRPPFIFSLIFPASLVTNPTDVPSDDRLIGSAYAIAGAIVQAAQFVALRKMRKINYATIAFFYGASTAPFLIALTFAMGKFQMPPGYLDRLMAIGIAVAAQTGQIFMTLAAKFVPAGIVSLTRSAEVAFGFIWQVAFFGVIINLFSMIGLILVSCSMIFLTARQVITEKYGGLDDNNKLIRFILFISR